MNLLTEPEKAAIRQSGELWSVICELFPGATEGELAELRFHIHGIQRTIMSVAAARAYPDEFRAFGDQNPPWLSGELQEYRETPGVNTFAPTYRTPKGGCEEELCDLPSCGCTQVKYVHCVAGHPILFKENDEAVLQAVPDEGTSEVAVAGDAPDAPPLHQVQSPAGVKAGEEGEQK